MKINRYNKLFPEATLGKTVTIEFFVDNGKLWITFNNTKMLFKDFIVSKQPDGKKIIDIVFNHIIKRYEDAVYGYLQMNKPKSQIIVDFITRYFSLDKTPLDIIIRSNGKVEINPEKPIGEA